MAVSEERVRAIEDRVAALETVNAVDAERHKTLVARLDKIDGHISKLVWLVIVAIVAAFMNFIIRGGLNVLG